jgi:hypothetical protein
MPCTIVPHLMGGLGNWLFQVAAAVKFSQDIGVDCVLSHTALIRSPHSNTDYLSTVLTLFKQRKTLRQNGLVQITEPSNFNHLNYKELIYTVSDRDIDILLLGYFQNHQFIPRGFKNMLNLPTLDTTSVKDTCFIHIRGGDYIKIPRISKVHNVDLSDYYKRSISIVRERGIESFSIFTNDKEYANMQGFLKDINHTFVDASEVESLVLMSECAACICANSSFSWWGAYLNPDRLICMPSRWVNTESLETSGYYFPGATIVNV